MVRHLDSEHRFVPVIAKPSIRDQVYAQPVVLSKDLLWRCNNEFGDQMAFDRY
jgi:hypothetical protein